MFSELNSKRKEVDCQAEGDLCDSLDGSADDRDCCTGSMCMGKKGQKYCISSHEVYRPKGNRQN